MLPNSPFCKQSIIKLKIKWFCGINRGETLTKGLTSYLTDRVND